MGSHKRMARKGAIYSKQMKAHPTKAEKIVKKWLESYNIWFKFQTYFHDGERLYIPDFRLRHKYWKIIIEIDGASHKGRKQYDDERTEWLLKNRNCRVTRFTNYEVINDMPSVMQKILALEPVKNSS